MIYGYRVTAGKPQLKVQICYRIHFSNSGRIHDRWHAVQLNDRENLSFICEGYHRKRLNSVHFWGLYSRLFFHLGIYENHHSCFHTYWIVYMNLAEIWLHVNSIHSSHLSLWRCIWGIPACFHFIFNLHLVIPVQSAVNMNLYTPLRLEWSPLTDFANKVKATYKWKEKERRHHIS